MFDRRGLTAPCKALLDKKHYINAPFSIFEVTEKSQESVSIFMLLPSIEYESSPDALSLCV